MHARRMNLLGQYEMPARRLASYPLAASSDYQNSRLIMLQGNNDSYEFSMIFIDVAQLDTGSKRYNLLWTEYVATVGITHPNWIRFQKSLPSRV